MDDLTAFEAKHMYDEQAIDEVDAILALIRSVAKNNLHTYWHKQITLVAQSILRDRGFELRIESNGSTRISWENA